MKLFCNTKSENTINGDFHYLFPHALEIWLSFQIDRRSCPIDISLDIDIRYTFGICECTVEQK